MRTTAIVGAALACCVATGASAAEVTDKARFKASVEKVWAAIGNFCGIASWHPAAAGCELSKKGDTTLRTIALKGGGQIVEQQLAWDDKGHSYSYAIVESPLPVAGYKSTMKVEGDGTASQVVWVGSFEAKGASEEEAKKVIEGIYAAGLDGIKAKLNGM